MVLLEAAGYKVPSISFDIQTGPAEIIEEWENRIFDSAVLT